MQAQMFEAENRLWSRGPVNGCAAVTINSLLHVAPPSPQPVNSSPMRRERRSRCSSSLSATRRGGMRARWPEKAGYTSIVSSDIDRGMQWVIVAEAERLTPEQFGDSI